MYITVDFALIAAALAPILTILVTAWAAGKKMQRNESQLNDIHTLVNDQMTREKAARLYDLRAQKRVLERVLGKELSEADKQMLNEMERQIEGMAVEVEKRNQVAAEIKAAESSDEEE